MTDAADDGHLRILAGGGESATTVRRSRFLGHAAPVHDGRGGLSAFVEALRARHRDASHVVYAWRGRDGASRSSDDGEPAGTGGRPLAAVLERAGLVDSAVAVARVFGGVLLGAAGLGRAYGEAAALAVAAAPVAVLRPYVAVEAACAYADQPAVEAVLRGRLVDPTRVFGPAGVELRGEVAAEALDALAQAVAAASAGRAVLGALGDPHWR